jgi:hypothetical protein
LAAQSSSTLPGLYLTNAVVLPDGCAQFEVRTPDATNAFALLYSFNLQTWGYWTNLNSGTNRYVIQTPWPISTVGTIFLRAAPLGQAIYNLAFNFRSFWNGPLANGTPVMSWPQQMQNWNVCLQVGNCTNLPACTNVLFSGPPGSGITNEPAVYGPHSGYGGTYDSRLLSSSSPPSGGTWTVQYGTNLLAFATPDPQLASRYVVMVPSFVVSNGQLSSVSWTYCNPNTGAILGTVPDFVAGLGTFEVYGGDFRLWGADDNTIYESPTLSRRFTNFVFSPPIEWTNGMLDIQYVDTLNNRYDFQYSFGNQYEVYGGTSLSGVDGYDPVASGLTFLGSATNTSTFNGAYNVYLVWVPKHNVVKVDTVQGSNGLYYNTYFTGNTTDYQNIGGPPDNQYAIVGYCPGVHWIHTGGYIGIDATGVGLTSLKVFVVP